jgi:hypothetical protein
MLILDKPHYKQPAVLMPIFSTVLQFKNLTQPWDERKNKD